MNNQVFEKLSRFGYHDTTITSINVTNNGLELVFDDGLYNLSNTGKETTKTPRIKVLLIVEGFDMNALYEYVAVCYQKKHKVIELQLEESSELNGFNYLVISDVYFSNFNNTILIKCSGNKLVNSEIIVENIRDIEFCF